MRTQVAIAASYIAALTGMSLKQRRILASMILSASPGRIRGLNGSKVSAE